MPWIHFESVEMFHLIWLVPALALIVVLAGRRARRAVGEQPGCEKINGKCPQYDNKCSYYDNEY